MDEGSDVERSDGEGQTQGTFQRSEGDRFHEEEEEEGGALFAEEAEEAPERSGNLDQTAALEVKEAKKRVIKNPQPKLNPERLMSDRGLQNLEEIFKDWKPRGKGHEYADLETVMIKMNHWTHRLFPKRRFDDTLDIIANRLGNKKVTMTYVKKLRMGMVAPVHVGGGEDGDVPPDADDEDDVARYEGDIAAQAAGNDEDLFAQVFPSAAAPAAAASAPSAAAGTGPTEEQLERMRRNKELAARRRREREEQRRREEEQDQELRDMEEDENRVSRLSPEKEKPVNPISNSPAVLEPSVLTPTEGEITAAASSEGDAAAETPAAAVSEWDQETPTGEPDTCSEKDCNNDNDQVDGEHREVLDLDGIMEAMDEDD